MLTRMLLMACCSITLGTMMPTVSVADPSSAADLPLCLRDSLGTGIDTLSRADLLEGIMESEFFPTVADANALFNAKRYVRADSIFSKLAESVEDPALKAFVLFGHTMSVLHKDFKNDFSTVNAVLEDILTQTLALSPLHNLSLRVWLQEIYPPLNVYKRLYLEDRVVSRLSENQLHAFCELYRRIGHFFYIVCARKRFDELSEDFKIIPSYFSADPIALETAKQLQDWRIELFSPIAR